MLRFLLHLPTTCIHAFQRWEDRRKYFPACVESMNDHNKMSLQQKRDVFSQFLLSYMTEEEHWKLHYSKNDLVHLSVAIAVRAFDKE